MEESELAHWITELTVIGYVSEFQSVKEMAKEIKRQHLCQINGDGIKRVYYPLLSKKWVKSFINRHLALESTIAISIDSTWIKNVTKDMLIKWFNDVHRVFDENNIDMRNVYNIDESGFLIEKINAICIIINKWLYMKYQAQLDCQEWISVIKYICTDGTAMPLLIIFKGENLLSS